MTQRNKTDRHRDKQKAIYGLSTLQKKKKKSSIEWRLIALGEGEKAFGSETTNDCERHQG